MVAFCDCGMKVLVAYTGILNGYCVYIQFRNNGYVPLPMPG